MGRIPPRRKGHRHWPEFHQLEHFASEFATFGTTDSGATPLAVVQESGRGTCNTGERRREDKVDLHGKHAVGRLLLCGG